MALPANPMEALRYLDQLAGMRQESRAKKIGDGCFWEGARYPNAIYETKLVNGKGELCTVEMTCNGVCHNGQVVATDCDPDSVTWTDCVPVKNPTVTFTTLPST